MEEDKHYCKLAQEKEEQEKLREQKVKMEMEKFYKTLADEAEKLEEKALWKIKRLNLRDQVLFSKTICISFY